MESMEEREQHIIKRRREIEEKINFDSRTALSELPESLFSEILFRVPLKSIFSSKSVSKAWLSHISDPFFARSYASYSSSSSSATWTLLYRYNDDPESLHRMGLKSIHGDHPVFGSPNFTLRFLSDAAADLRDSIFVLAVSNGLLLVTTRRQWHDCYYICNPLTKQWSALPQPPRIHNWVTLGFMVEPSDGSFQILRIGGYKGLSKVVNFEVFTSKTGQWTDKIASFDHPVHLFIGRMLVNFFRAVPCKKILYWMTYNYGIIAYDTTSQQNNDNQTPAIQCSLIDLPGERVAKSELKIHMIGVCRDQLRYIQLVRTSRKLRVWELRDNDKDGEKEKEWVLLHSIFCSADVVRLLVVGQLVAFDPFDPHIVYVTFERPSMASRRSPITLASINPMTGNCTDICEPGYPIFWWSVFPFILPTWPTPVLGGEDGILCPECQK